MPRPPALRVLVVAAAGSESAIAAHGGAAGVTDPRWMLPSLTAALACVWAVVAGTRLARGALAPLPGSPVGTACLLLLAQAVAHLTLLELHVAPSMGQPGAIALHVALALVAAAAIVAAERALAHRIADAVRRLLELLAEAAPLGLRPRRDPYTRTSPHRAAGRAPPVPA